MNGMNITFGQIPDIQIIGTGNRRINVTRMINALSALTRNEDESRDESENIPVSQEFLNELEEKNITNEMIDKKSECSICLDTLKENEKYIQLPCSENSHCFHSDCIKEWLSRNNTCPLCRTEFPQRRHRTTYSSLLSNLSNGPLISNISPDIGDNNIIDNSDEFILNTIDNFLRDVTEEINNPTPVPVPSPVREPILNTGDSDLQRAIELSLQDLE